MHHAPLAHAPVDPGTTLSGHEPRESLVTPTAVFMPPLSAPGLEHAGSQP
jgi:hypothetical protein